MRNLIAFFCFLIVSIAAAQPYSPPAGELGSTAIYKDSSLIKDWASVAVLHRGYLDIRNKLLGKTTVGEASSAIGAALSNGVVSLGDSGYIDLQFPGELFDGPGPDFAVFENAFDEYFLELAFVEVSSNGIDFYRFPAVSLTDTSSQVNSFDSLNTRNLHLLAGKFQAGYGVPFDLALLNNIPSLNIQHISHVRIVDVIGSINNSFCSRDVNGNPVNDPFPTAFPSGGFDLDAVGAINIRPAGINENKSEQVIQFFPNPASNFIQLDDYWLGAELQLYNQQGQLQFNKRLNSTRIELSSLPRGMYFLRLENNQSYSSAKLILE